MNLFLRQAMVVNEEGMADRPQDLLIENGKIARIGERLSPPGERCPTMDGKGRYLLPGLIDLHVHFRVPGQEYKEDLLTGSRAAVKGGFTTVMCMPNTCPVIDNRAVVESIREESRELGLLQIIPIGAITRGQLGEALTDMFELKEAGCLALSDDGRSVLNSQVMRLALQYADMVGLLLIEHCQDPDLTSGGVMNEGVTATRLGLKGDPAVAETVIVARDIELARYLKTRVHLAHMSLARSVDLIRQAKAEGVAVSAEVCPHHFALTEEAVKDFDPSTKVNPPLRTAEDVAALKQALADGTLDCIVTDHAPHSLEDKEKGFDAAPPGMIGLETSLALTVQELVEKKFLTWPQCVDKMSTTPARLVGLNNKGRIEEGYDADLTLVDPKKEWVFRKEDIASKSCNSPFLGRTFRGRVEATIFEGRVVYEAAEAEDG